MSAPYGNIDIQLHFTVSPPGPRLLPIPPIYHHREAVEKQDEDEDEEEEADQATTPAAVRSSKKKPVKERKKGRRGRKPKGKSKTAVPAPTGLDQVPLESYRIIEDDTGIITDYLMATYSLSLNNGLSCAITSKESGAMWPTKA